MSKYKIYIDDKGFLMTSEKVLFENQKLINELVHKRYGFYDVNEFYDIEIDGRIEIQERDTVEDGGGCYVAGTKRVAVIIPEPKEESEIDIAYKAEIEELKNEINRMHSKCQEYRTALANIIDATEDKGGQFRAWHNHLRSTTTEGKKLIS